LWSVQRASVTVVVIAVKSDYGLVISIGN